LDPAVIDRTKFLSALPASKEIDSAKEIDSPKEIDSALCAGGTIQQSTRSPSNPHARENEELDHARE
jgi:hypothetical protein